MRQHCPSKAANGIEGGMQACWKLVFDCSAPAWVCQCSGIDLLTRSHGTLYLRANSNIEKKEDEVTFKSKQHLGEEPKDQNFQKLAIWLWKRNLKEKIKMYFRDCQTKSHLID